MLWGDILSVKCFSIRIEEEMLNKIRFISEYEGRSANKHILILIRENIKLFEMQNGKIEDVTKPAINVKPARKSRT